MKVSAEEVRRIAVLARLRLTPEEEIELTGQLDRILEYMEDLGKLDTSKVPPFTHAVESIELREDKVTNRPNAEALLANAPDSDRNFFRVPKIIE